jgi:Transglutaminase-like superfamily
LCYLPELTDNANSSVIVMPHAPMMNSSPLVRLRRLSGERRRLLLRAAILLSGASAVVALLPFPRAIRFGLGPLGRRQPVAVEEIVSAIQAAARRLPWRTMCIEQGLAAQRMLRSAGTDAILHYGARHHLETGKLEAHVWVTVDGRAVIGGEEAADFALVASYP